MADGKNEKMDWWRLSLKLGDKAKLDAELPEGSRIERLKAALNKKAGREQQPVLPLHRDMKSSPTETIALPLQSDPDQHRYPDVLERGYRAPLYPVQSPPRVPTLTRTMYDGDKASPPRSPPRALVTSGLTRSTTRNSDRRQLPRSPAGRRKSWLTRGNQFRHPFLPLKDSDAPLPQISAPTPVPIDPSNPKLNYSVSIGKPRTAPLPPSDTLVPAVSSKGAARRAPTPLQLAPGSAEPLGSGRGTGLQARFGLPNTPRINRNQSPAV